MKELIEKANNIDMSKFKTKKQAIAYIVKLNDELSNEEEILKKQIKELDEKLWQVKGAKGKTFIKWNNLVFKQKGQHWKNV